MIEQLKGGGWTFLLFLVGLMTTIGTSMPVGYLLGVVNTPAEFVKAWSKDMMATKFDWHWTDYQIDVLWACVVSAFLVGGICGSFAAAWCSSKFGRKGSLLISSVLLLIGSVLFTFCVAGNSVIMLLLGRFISGLAAALIFTAQPMYLMELAPLELRGSVGTFTAIGVCGGICVGQIFSLDFIFGTEDLWQYAFSFYGVFVLLSLPFYYWFPESPRWLYIIADRREMAALQLKRLRGKDAEDRITAELREMEAATKESTERLSFMAVFKNREFTLPLILVCVYMFSQQLSGINAIFYYSMPIYLKAGFSSTAAQWLNLAAGFLNTGVTALAPYLVKRIDRRPLTFVSAGGCAICLFVITFGLYWIDFADWLPGFCMAFIALYIILFEIGLGPIAYFIGSELFEVAPRPVAMSLGSLCSWTGNFMIGMFFPMMQAVVDSFAFLPCCCFCIFSLIFMYFYLPETRGRDPAEVKVLVKDGFKSKVK